ncbi:peptidylprolyl isomerase [Salinarimonas ramus]|uniref:Parvulin-like PPIase n=1 Tax=Salinarimonas ramus TaxID=690164 RepID=A0A917QIV6_9HYPH|nr:peptidylprolyl isomerase [Salinarimonas ramus]GGK51182.1 hypothetical protein GCM10011322_42830 [Salinarimonas ramus]
MAHRIEIDHRATTRRPAPTMPEACSSGGCGGGPASEPPPPLDVAPVRVEGVEISPEAIAREMQNHPASDPQTAWGEAARALIVRALLLGEAKRLGLATEADDHEPEDDALIRALLEARIEVVPVAGDEERRFYDENAHRFRTPDLFEVSHVLIEPDGDADAASAEAEETVRALIAEVGDDPAAFAEAARGLSTCPSAKQDGSLGQVRLREIAPSLAVVVESLSEGETHREPVRSRFGWHAVRLHRRIAGRVLPFEAVRERIADMLEARSWSQAASDYVAELVARANIEGVQLSRIPAGAGDAR